MRFARVLSFLFAGAAAAVPANAADTERTMPPWGSDMPLPKGTKVEVVAHYDNSSGNKYNPDPSKDVKWGDQTWEEMMIGFWGSVVAAAPAAR